MELKRFIAKIMILATLLVSTYFLAQWQLSKGYVDYYYHKFTYPAGSMILGVSRAFDGVVPSIIQEELSNEAIAMPVLNFSFELAQSSYGPVYLEAIRKKLNPATKNGLFILSVSPGNLSIPQSVPDTVEFVTDQYSLFTKIKRMNSQPNFEYIREFYGEALYKGFIRYAPYNIRTVHKDGWMEVVLKTRNLSITQSQINGWTKQTMDSYEQRVSICKPSQVRLGSLKETIEFLKMHGEVFLVRMPTDAGVLAIENKFWPKFEEEMAEIAHDYQITFLSYAWAADHFQTYDGSHLVSASAKEFTRMLCDDITAYCSNEGMNK